MVGGGVVVEVVVVLGAADVVVGVVEAVVSLAVVSVLVSFATAVVFFPTSGCIVVAFPAVPAVVERVAVLVVAALALRVAVVAVAAGKKKRGKDVVFGDWLEFSGSCWPGAVGIFLRQNSNEKEVLFLAIIMYY